MKATLDNKMAKTNDEIKFISHMHQIIKNGLLGRNEHTVIGEEPAKRFFSGVLFPDFESFLSQASDEKLGDPQPVFKSLAKNCNIGLEYLVREENSKIKISLEGSFKIYYRVFPTFGEQIAALDYLNLASSNSDDTIDDNFSEEETIEPDDQEETNETGRQEDDSPTTSVTTEERPDRGLTLLEKYESIEINFKDLIFTLEPGILDYDEIDLDKFLQSAIQQIASFNQSFTVDPSNISKTGFITLPNRPDNEEAFQSWLDSIRSKELIVPNWSAKIAVETRPYRKSNGDYINRIITTLINKTNIPNREANEKPTGHPLEFYDCQLKVRILEGIHQPFEFDAAPRDYKYEKKIDVKGINCVGISQDDGLATECIPDYFQKHYRTREDFTIYFRDLTSPEKTKDTLMSIVTDMKGYLAEWKLFIDNMGNGKQTLKNNEERDQCLKEYDEFKEEIESFELGIYALTQSYDKRLMTAFNLMNKVFIKSGEGKYDSWRLFQIVYIVRILPSLYAREVKDDDIRVQEIIDSVNYIDVLWFPTGGGKTEAYLGLIVCALFYDRLRGKKRGCSSWIRFPLRMLSKNQLDRLAKVLIRAEEVRQNDEQVSNRGKMFSIGFFAGGGNTPNFITEKMKKFIFSSEQNKKKHMLLHKCPNCGGEVSLDFDEVSWKLLHRCTNDECFVVKSPILNGCLPIYITDSEVYRFVPSVLVGTVDKLAIMSRYREFSHIFGQVVGLCDQHGFYSDQCFVGKRDRYGSCDQKINSTVKRKMKELRESFYDPVPCLLIQDELHLLKEELGVLDGHYEGALNEFARNLGRKPTDLPKVIAATATIESYEHHISHLYIRKPRRYPSMGYINGESFYATSTPNIDRRLYIGVLPHAKSQEEVISRCLYLYQREIYRLYSKSSDIWREFGFNTVDSEQSFLELLAYYDLSVVYVNKKPLGNDILRRINESTSPNLKRDTGQDFDILTQILTGENDMDKIVEVIDRVENESRKEYRDKLHTLIATSLISHGVDLERINAFFMAGMPSKSAEYIQASSRSARSHVGLVVCCFKPNDLRERSQFQYFVPNHIFLDRLVDPVPINRLSLKAIERSLPGLLSSLLYCLHSQTHIETIDTCLDYIKYIAKRNVKDGNIEGEITSQLKRIIGVYFDYFTPTAKEKAEKFIETEFKKLHHHLNTTSGKIKDEKVLNPITSFRDIEEGLDLIANTKTAVIINESNRD